MDRGKNQRSGKLFPLSCIISTGRTEDLRPEYSEEVQEKMEQSCVIPSAHQLLTTNFPFRSKIVPFQDNIHRGVRKFRVLLLTNR